MESAIHRRMTITNHINRMFSSHFCEGSIHTENKRIYDSQNLIINDIKAKKIVSMLTKNNYCTLLLFFCLAIFAIVPSQQNEDGAEVYIEGYCQALGLSFDKCHFECRYRGYTEGHCRGFMYTDCWCTVPNKNQSPPNSI
ncbi:Similar to Defensin (Galleria mellonella) [Cotesia congregata]|uniref:Similar to Defensin (Galleria mellonella) n=1 Tax=Cotesia congregata TaxID=51543 RepID=A0A8J2H7H9_COTCN|nr:Similar to Defensin (Galleria mellonella) [Cotesia congregata]